jgi:hypothetical protein
VPTPRTRPDEVIASVEVAADLATAVELAVDGKAAVKRNRLAADKCVATG